MMMSLTNNLLADSVQSLIGRIRRKEAENPILFSERIAFKLDNWQSDVLASVSKKIILNNSRQSGKSAVVALLACHKAINKAGSLILIVCPSERQSGELLRKIKGYLAKADVEFNRDSILTVELSNGSRILALPSSESNIRTFSAVDLLVLDEASRIDDIVYFAVKPMLAVSKGAQILLSTPNGKRGFFYETWVNGNNEWQKIEITANDCPRITPEFLASEKLSMPEFLYLQEYFCQFTDTDTQIFPSALIEAAINPNLKAIAW